MADLEVTVDFRDLKQFNDYLNKTSANVRATVRDTSNSFREFQRSSREVDRLRRSIDPAYASLAKLEDQVRILDNALKTGSINRTQYNQFLGQVRANSDVAAGGVGNLGRRMNRAGVLTQQAGYQIGDFIVQVQSGTNAFVAFGQQATQVAGTLTLLQGKWVAIGSILGIVIPLVTAVGAAMMRTESSFSVFNDLAYALEPIQPLLDAISSAFNIMANLSIDAINLLLNNLDRLVVTATMLVGFFGVRFVAAFVAARVATITLSGALVFLRGAIIRTGIGALIVGAGELVYQFTRLVSGAGGFGNALALLKDVAVETFDRIKNSFRLVPLAIKAGSAAMASFFLEKLANMAGQFVEFTWTVAEGLNNLFGTNLQGASPAVGNELRFMALDLENVAASASSEMADLASSLTAPLDSLEALREAMAAADREGRNIDIRNWFGGGTEDAASGAADALTTLQERVQSVADTIKDSMGEAFMSMVDGTKSAIDAFKDMGRAIIKKLFDILVVQQLVGQFDASSGTGSGIVGAIMGAFTGARASGGTMMPNQPYLVGERGPELVVPGRQSTVMNRNLTANSGGGQQEVSVRVFVDDNGNFDAKVEGISNRQIARAAPALVDRSVSAVVEQTQRGGSVARVFR